MDARHRAPEVGTKHERWRSSSVGAGCGGADGAIIVCLDLAQRLTAVVAHDSQFVVSASTRLMASSNIKRSRVEVCFVKRTLAELVRPHGACTIVDSAPAFKSVYL
jgi:hypothetical protein